jgi:heme exporter protein A
MKLSVSDVVVERGGRALFAPLSFSADDGALVRITGANGTGKTTLLRALEGLVSIANGNIEWRHASSPNENGRTSIFIGHSNSMNDSLTTQENWAFAAGVAGFSISRDDVRAALESMGVASLIDRRIGTLSQGQRKRVTLAQLLLPFNRNAAWLLDEPFVALDAATQLLLAKHISEALARGTLVLLTSHQSVDIAASKTLEISL